MVISMLNPEAMSVSLLAFVRNPTVIIRICSTFADASCWRLCAAIYKSSTFVLVAWATYRLSL